MNSNNNDDCHQVVSDYFRLIKNKDMDGLLNLFTEDCIIYEPFSKVSTLYTTKSTNGASLEGRFEIESFLNIVMMACDGLEFEIKFIVEPIDIDNGQLTEIFGSTFCSSSLISVLATFYGKKGEAELKERFTFCVASEKNHDSVITSDTNYFNSVKIKTLWIQSCLPESAS